MSAAIKASRTQPWLESLGDWAWPGRTAVAEGLLLPPSWVSAFPPRLEPAASSPPVSSAVPLRDGVAQRRRLLLVTLLSALAAVSCALALQAAGALSSVT